jgi:parallel beta-helix repeat protein
MFRVLGLGFFTIFVLGSLLLPFGAQLTEAHPKLTFQTIEVYPGDKAIRKALRQANSGDHLNIHAGTYNERVKVSKVNVTLKAAGDGEVIIDPQCETSAAIRVAAEGVVINGLTVRGGSFYAITVEGVARGEIRNNAVESTCDGAEYGVNVFNSGSVKVIGNSGFGWDDAVVYVGSISSAPTGPLVVKKNETHDSVRGIIIEDSDNVEIKVIKNVVYDNTLLGIFVHNSDEVLFRANDVTNNADNGIFLDSPSDGNIVRDNTFTGHTIDIRNEGSGNCFSGNTFNTSTGTLDPC